MTIELWGPSPVVPEPIRPGGEADQDVDVPPGESEAFAAWLQSAGVSAEFVLMPGAAEHWSIYPASPNFLPIMEAMEAFAAGVLE